MLLRFFVCIGMIGFCVWQGLVASQVPSAAGRHYFPGIYILVPILLLAGLNKWGLISWPVATLLLLIKGHVIVGWIPVALLAVTVVGNKLLGPALSDWKREAVDSVIARCREYAVGWGELLPAEYPCLLNAKHWGHRDIPITVALADLAYRKCVEGLPKAQDQEYLLALRERLHAWRPLALTMFDDVQSFIAQLGRVSFGKQYFAALGLWIVARLYGVTGQVTEDTLDPDALKVGAHIAGAIESVHREWSEMVAPVDLT
jgi:hypothetical protein